MNPQQPYQQGPPQGYPGNGYPGHYPPLGPQVVLRGDRNGLGTAALVLGITAVIFSFIPLVGIIAWPIGITGLILGFVGLGRVNRREATNRGVAIAGLITSGAALVICVLWLVGIGIAGSQATPSRAPLPTVGAVSAAKTNAPAAPAQPAGPATRIGDGTSRSAPTWPQAATRRPATGASDSATGSVPRTTPGTSARSSPTTFSEGRDR